MEQSNSVQWSKVKDGEIMYWTASVSVNNKKMPIATLHKHPRDVRWKMAVQHSYYDAVKASVDMDSAKYPHNDMLYHIYGYFVHGDSECLDTSKLGIERAWQNRKEILTFNQDFEKYATEASNG